MASTPTFHGNKISVEHESSHNSAYAVGDLTSNDRMPPSLRNLSQDEQSRLELKVRQKIDLRLMPMIVLIYIMNYLDRNNIAAARLAGLEQELGLSSTQYQASLAPCALPF